MRDYVTMNPTNVRAEAHPVRGNEPLPEPYESAARMVYGDPAHNEAFISREDFRVGSLHRWRQHPEIIDRVRFLATNHRRRIQAQALREKEMVTKA